MLLEALQEFISQLDSIKSEVVATKEYPNLQANQLASNDVKVPGATERVLISF